MEAEERVVLIDETNQVIGTARKSEIHTQPTPFIGEYRSSFPTLGSTYYFIATPQSKEEDLAACVVEQLLWSSGTAGKQLPSRQAKTLG